MDYLSNAYGIKNNWWRYLIVLFVPYFFAMIADRIFCLLVFDSKSVEAIERNILSENYYVEIAKMGYVNGFLYEMCISIFLLFFFLLFYKLIHKGSIKNLITAAPLFRGGRFLFGIIFFGLIWIVILLFELGIRGMFPYVEVSFKAKDFFIGVILSMFFFALQTLYEEIFMRGYIQQGVALLLRNRLLVLLFVSGIFAILHYTNQPVLQYGLIAMIPYLLSAICFGLCSVLDDGLEISWGMHFVNNLFCGVVIYFPEGETYMPTLFKSTLPQVMDGLSIATYTVQSIIFLLIATKVYHWDWSRLFKKIERPAVGEA